MIYRFVIVSDEADNFKLQIAIDSTATFMQLRNIILESAGYSKDQMDSFYICDDEWNKERKSLAWIWAATAMRISGS